MIQNQKDLGNLINKLSTPLGRARAVVHLSQQYTVPEEHVREAIAILEKVYEEDDRPGHKNDEPIKTAAGLARKILWIEKTIDLTAKTDKTKAAEIAVEFSFNERAFELYNEAGDYRAIRVAHELGLNDEYIELCTKHQKFSDAVNKHLELKQETEAKELFKQLFIDKKGHGRFVTNTMLITIAKETDLQEYAIELCEENNKFELLAEIAAETERPKLASENFEKAGKFMKAAGQALLLSNYSAYYIGVARELYFKEIERLKKESWTLKEQLEVLKMIDVGAGKSNDVSEKIFDAYVKLKKFEEGANYFESQKDLPRALSLFEKGDKLVDARNLAKEHGLTDKVEEYAKKLGSHEEIAQIENTKGNFESAISSYRKQIEEYVVKEHYDRAADIALKVVQICKEKDASGLSEEFRLMSKDLFLKEAEKDEQGGHWESAAKMAEKAGNTERTAIYRELENIARAYHTL